jgi:hypothetical protein
MAPGAGWPVVYELGLTEKKQFRRRRGSQELMNVSKSKKT